ncbi:MAG: hypothetical protein CMC96_01450 [Flavobacteriales bacterium]|nr:hypothetical protein [Flavobacteriales bacterium]
MFWIVKKVKYISNLIIMEITIKNTEQPFTVVGWSTFANQIKHRISALLKMFRNRAYLSIYLSIALNWFKIISIQLFKHKISFQIQRQRNFLVSWF